MCLHLRGVVICVERSSVGWAMYDCNTIHRSKHTHAVGYRFKQITLRELENLDADPKCWGVCRLGCIVQGIDLHLTFPDPGVLCEISIRDLQAGLCNILASTDAHTTPIPLITEMQEHMNTQRTPLSHNTQDQRTHRSCKYSTQTSITLSCLFQLQDQLFPTG